MDFTRILTDGIALVLLGVSAGFLARRFFRKTVAPALASFLLRRNRIAWAMRLRGGAPSGRACGGDCDCG